MAVTTRTIVGKVLAPDHKTALDGEYRFTPTQEIKDTAGAIMPKRAIIAPFQANPPAGSTLEAGEFSVDLIANDSDDLAQTAATYRVELVLASRPGRIQSTFNIVVPKDGTGDIELGDLAPVAEAGETFLYLTEAVADGRYLQVDALPSNIVTEDNIGDFIEPVDLTGYATTQALGTVDTKASDALTAATTAQTNAGTALSTATDLATRVPFKPYVYDVRQYIQTGETLNNTGTAVANNVAIIQRGIDALTALYAADGQPRQLFIPNGKYKLATNGTDASKNAKWAIRIKTGVGIIGESTTGTVLLSAADSTVIYGAYGDPTQPLTDCLFQTFTIDGAAQTNATYTTQLKGMFIQYMLRPRWDRVTIRNTWATGLGCDFLQDYRIDGHISDGCGRGIRQLGVDPLTVSGGSGIGIGTGYTQNERGVITGALLTNNGKNGLFYETQTSVTFHSRGHSVVGGVSAGNHTGLHDCGCDGLDVSGMQLIDNLYAGLLLAGTVLEPDAGRNGRFNGIIARNGTAAIADSGGAVIGSLPSGRYTIEGVVAENVGHGVVSRSDANVGPGVRINADVRDNGGAGVFIGTTSTTPIKSLTIGGRVLSNGRNAASARREGVCIAAYTDGLTITGKISDDQATPTQQVGIYLRDASAVGRTTTNANINADVRGNVTSFKNETTLTGTVLALLGVSTADPTSLSATAATTSGAVDLSWTAPGDTSGVTDYAVQYRPGTSGTWQTFAHTASTATSIRVTGLTNGTSYQFQVAAVRNGSNTNFTNIATATPQASVTPLYADSFGGSNGTLAGRTLPDGSNTSKTWSLQSADNSGVIGIVNGTAKVTAGTVATYALFDAGSTSYRLSFSVPFLLSDTTKRKAALIFRYTDASNYWRVSPNNGTWLLQKIVGGTATTVVTGPATTAGDTAGVTVNADNSMILTVNGNQAGSTVTNQTDLASATLVGLSGQYTSGSGGSTVQDQTSAMDDFKLFTV